MMSHIWAARQKGEACRALRDSLYSWENDFENAFRPPYLNSVLPAFDGAFNRLLHHPETLSRHVASCDAEQTCTALVRRRPTLFLLQAGN